MMFRAYAAVSALIFLLILTPARSDATDVVGRAGAETFIKAMEAAWAEQSVSNDDKILSKILADDYIGVSSENKVMNKAQQIGEAVDAQKKPSEFLSNKVDYVDVHFFSDSLAVAQGRESWKLTHGESGRYIWVDTWLKRKGQWQIIASQDTKLASDP
jgi:hypothetical protein